MERYHYSESGLDNVWLVNGFEVMETSYGEAVSIHDLEGLHRVIGTTLCNQAPPLSPQEFRFLRIEMDMSQKALGLLLGKEEQTISLYERGKQDIPALADRVIRKLYKEYINEDGDLRELLEEMVYLDNEIDSMKRDLDFEETPDGWHPKAA